MGEQSNRYDCRGEQSNRYDYRGEQSNRIGAMTELFNTN